jgi:hypothetical protein
MPYQEMVTANEIRNRIEGMNFEVLVNKISEKMKQLDFFRIQYTDQRCDIGALIDEYEVVQAKEVDLDRLKEALNLNAYGLELHVIPEPNIEGEKITYISLSEEKQKQYQEMLEEKVNIAIAKFNTVNVNNVCLPYVDSFDSRMVANKFFNIAKEAGYEVTISPIQKTPLHPIKSYNVTINLA